MTDRDDRQMVHIKQMEVLKPGDTNTLYIENMSKLFPCVSLKKYDAQLCCLKSRHKVVFWRNFPFREMPVYFICSISYGNGNVL